jgi:hypothetical protein
VLDVNLKEFVLLRAVRREGHDLGRAARIDHQHRPGAALRGSPRGSALRGEQGRHPTLTRGDGARPLSHQGQWDRAEGSPTCTPQLGSSEAELIEVARSIPLGRIAQPEEIARAAIFLASDNAGFVTGQTLHVNGGSYLA